MLIVSGFFAKENTYAKYLIPIKYISLFKWVFQILIMNEFKDGSPLTCSNYPDKCDLLADLNFKESMAVSYACTAATTIGFGLVAYILLHHLAKIRL